MKNLRVFGTPEERAKKREQREEERVRRSRERVQQEELRREQEREYYAQQEKQVKKREEVNRKTESPAQKARTARKWGHEIFQFIEVITETKGMVVPMVGVFVSDETGEMGLQNTAATARENKPAIEQIEAEGWNLINAGYVFQQTGSESRDKLLASGQQEAISGRVLGIYTFRLNTPPGQHENTTG